MNKIPRRFQKKTVAQAVITALGIALSGSAWAASSATQDVDIVVQSVSEIAVGSTVTLTINSGTAGENLSGTASSTYDITTNYSTSRKITAQLGTALSTGLSLRVYLQAPSGATSSGTPAAPVALSAASASDVVTSIEAVAASDLTIDYTASATVAVAPATYSAEVTYTVVADS